MGGHHSKDKQVSQPKPAAMDSVTTITTHDQAAAPAWSALLGEDNWFGLLDPLNLHLRTLILRCGDFCQGTYDAFNNNANSKYAGSSGNGHAAFFDKVMLQHAVNYQIACFLYATAQVSIPEAILLHSLSHESWDRESNWIGYIAITTDEHIKSLGRREIYVAWRGTTRNYEWVNVLGAELVSPEQLLSKETELVAEPAANKDPTQTSSRDDSSSIDDEDEIPKVMRGWLSMYTSDDLKSSFTVVNALQQKRS